MKHLSFNYFILGLIALTMSTPADAVGRRAVLKGAASVAVAPAVVPLADESVANLSTLGAAAQQSPTLAAESAALVAQKAWQNMSPREVMDFMSMVDGGRTYRLMGIWNSDREEMDWSDSGPQSNWRIGLIRFDQIIREHLLKLVGEAANFEEFQTKYEALFVEVHNSLSRKWNVPLLQVLEEVIYLRNPELHYEWSLRHRQRWFEPLGDDFANDYFDAIEVIFPPEIKAMAEAQDVLIHDREFNLRSKYYDLKPGQRAYYKAMSQSIADRIDREELSTLEQHLKLSQPVDEKAREAMQEVLERVEKRWDIFEKNRIYMVKEQGAGSLVDRYKGTHLFADTPMEAFVERNGFSKGESTAETDRSSQMPSLSMPDDMPKTKLTNSLIQASIPSPAANAGAVGRSSLRSLGQVVISAAGNAAENVIASISRMLRSNKGALVEVPAVGEVLALPPPEERVELKLSIDSGDEIKEGVVRGRESQDQDSQRHPANDPLFNLDDSEAAPSCEQVIGSESASSKR